MAGGSARLRNVAIGVVTIGVALAVLVLMRVDGDEADPAGPSPTSTPAAADAAVRFRGVAYQGGSSRACLVATSAGEAEEACLPTFRLFVWHVHDRDYVLSTAPLPLADDITVEPGASGFAVVPYREISDELRDPVNCITSAAVEGMGLHLGPRAAAYAINSCAHNAAVATEMTPAGDYGSTSTVLAPAVTGAPMSVVATYDNDVRDRVERCAPVPDVAPPEATQTLNELCLWLGG